MSAQGIYYCLDFDMGIAACFEDIGPYPYATFEACMATITVKYEYMEQDGTCERRAYCDFSTPPPGLYDSCVSCQAAHPTANCVPY